ncbi:incA family protein, partial [Chlamydia psittaci 08-2626_L3]
MSEQHPIHQ